MLNKVCVIGECLGGGKFLECPCLLPSEPLAEVLCVHTCTDTYPAFIMHFSLSARTRLATGALRMGLSAVVPSVPSGDPALAGSVGAWLHSWASTSDTAMALG